jgi:hypothetical protein
MNFSKTDNALWDKKNSRIDTETDTFDAETERLKLFFVTLPQLAAARLVLAKESSRQRLS